jgi:hypothetical protein
MDHQPITYFNETSIIVVAGSLVFLPLLGLALALIAF